MRNIIVFVGPSGSGKTVLGQLALQPIGGKEVVSTTTRAPRKGEVNGVNYHFVSKDEFEQLIFDKVMLEYTFYAGEYYGLQKKTVSDMLSANNLVYAVLDIKGAQAMKEQFGDKVATIFIRVRPETIYRRMAERGDDPAAIQRRIDHAAENREFDNGYLCDYSIDNEGSLEAAIEAIRKIVEV